MYHVHDSIYISYKYSHLTEKLQLFNIRFCHFSCDMKKPVYLKKNKIQIK